MCGPRRAVLCGLPLSVPCHRGKPLQYIPGESSSILCVNFQSPAIGASLCNRCSCAALLIGNDLSVPCHRGKPLQFTGTSPVAMRRGSFSPLPSGQASAICFFLANIALKCVGFQSPAIGASLCNCIAPGNALNERSPFSPLPSGQASAIYLPDRKRYAQDRLSVPCHRGKPLQWSGFRASSALFSPFSPLPSGQASAMIP